MITEEQGATRRSYRNTSSIHRGQGEDKKDDDDHEVTTAPIGKHNLVRRGGTRMIRQSSSSSFADSSMGGETTDLGAPKTKTEDGNSSSVPMFGILLVLFATFSQASIGVALRLQAGGVGPLMKCYWRQQATAACLFPLALPKFTAKQFQALSKKEWLFDLPLISVCYAFITAGFVIGLDETSLANAYILSSLSSIIIIVVTLLLGKPVMKLEALGSLVALAGGVVCAMAPDHDQHPKRVVGNNDVNNGSKTSFTGDLICFATSFTAAAYLIIAQRLRAKLDMSVFMFLMYTISSLLVLSFIILNQTEPVSLSFHPVHGIFGWMNPMLDRLPLELWMVLVCNFVGGIGFVEALKYFSPVVISVVMLAEPAIAMLEGVVAGGLPPPPI
mmetsp:Transcript_18376/g.42876  ORF Transcript_18376/g.42876 Transcript_18376/m.42876 type:complete len:387 (+) Transcript_18376:113-1273(+)